MAGYGFNTGMDGHRVRPLTEADKEEIAEGLKIIYGKARERMLENVSGRLSRGITQRGWAERKANEVLAAHAQLERDLDRAHDQREKLLSGVMDRAYVTGSQKFYSDMRSVLGETAHISPNSMKAGYILADLNNSLNASERRILRQFDDKYADIIGAVSSEMATGTMTTRQAVGEALIAFADDGIDGFIDRGGHHWTLENYSEMAVLTAIERSTISGYVDTMQEYGYDLAIIDGHAGSCPICAAWEGVIVSVSGNDSDYPSLDDAENDGCFHPRCMHGITTYYPEISHAPIGGFRTEPREIEPAEPSYTARSKQRYMERMIRKYKDRAIVAQTPQQKMQAQNKVRQWENALDDLIESQPEDNYLYRHSNREKPQPQAIPLGTEFLHHASDLAVYAQKIKPIDGYQDFVLHGGKYGFENQNADGKMLNTFSVAEFCRTVQEKGLWNGGPIRLIACETGAEDALTAQAVADILGVPVMAPTDLVWVRPDGYMTIGPDKLTNTGSWRIVEPKER